MVITVTVTSEREIIDLGVRLYYPVDVTIEGIEYWDEPLRNPHVWTGWAAWEVSINAHQNLNFTRTLYLPLDEGEFNVIATIVEIASFRVSNELVIIMTTQGGTVYLANTPIPRTPGPVLLPSMDPELQQTLLAMPTYTPWPTLVPCTATPTFAAYPPPTEQDREGPGTPYP